MLAFIQENKGKYEKRGRQKSAQEANFAGVIKLARPLYGTLPVKDFTAKKLRECRKAMIKKGWTRKQINRQVNRIRQMMAWGVLEELMPPEVIHSLKCLPALQPGEDGVKERPKVKPVPEDLVNRCLPFMQKPIAAMVELMLWTGCRAGELVLLRPCDIDQSDDVWVYRPQFHKGEKAGKERNILIGPEAQKILFGWMENCPNDEYIFSPAKAEKLRLAERSDSRKTPPYPSHMRRNANKRVGNKRKRKPGKRYDVDAFRRAITYGIDKADRSARRTRDQAKDPESITPYRVKSHERLIPSWHPHQLRHTAATRLRKLHGIEMARVILGHSSIEVSELYAEIDLDQARAVMKSSG